MTRGSTPKPAAQGRTWPDASFDLVSLRIILAAAEEHSFAAAAQRENTSLSAVSRRVAELEQRIGVTLFKRHDKGVSLTEEGTQFVHQLYEVFDRLEHIALDLEEVRKGVRGVVRVSAPMTATSGNLPTKVAAFMLENPGIEVQFVEETSFAAIHGVSVGDLDLAVIPDTPAAAQLTCLPYFDDELVVVLPSGHALANKQSIRLADLVDEPFIGMPRDSGLSTLYREQMSAIGQTLKERAHTTSFESVRHMVSVGLGIAILPATAANPYAEPLGLVSRKLDEAWSKRQLVLCTREPDRRSAATRLLIAFLLS